MRRAARLYVLLLFFSSTLSVYAFKFHYSKDAMMRDSILCGTALAMVISYHKNHSIPWAIGHGLCSWLYVGYTAIKNSPIHIVVTSY